jgi:Na+-transporting methylmalonyl-CoA/oxaloacetate decarboxylase gamma subunit
LIYIILGLVALGFVIWFFKNEQSTTEEDVPSSQKDELTAEQQTQLIEDEDEIAAVIAAAIHACFGSQYVIKTITRVTGSQGSAWAQMGRIDAMNLRKL